jgi:hypothetical protein
VIDLPGYGSSSYLTEELVTLAAIEARGADPANLIKVAETGAPLHPIAKAVRDALLAAKPDDYASLRCQDGALPFVRVTKGGIERATLIIDANARAADEKAEVGSWIG